MLVSSLLGLIEPFEASLLNFSLVLSFFFFSFFSGLDYLFIFSFTSSIFCNEIREILVL